MDGFFLLLHLFLFRASTDDGHRRHHPGCPSSTHTPVCFYYKQSLAPPRSHHSDRAGRASSRGCHQPEKPPSGVPHCSEPHLTEPQPWPHISGVFENLVSLTPAQHLPSTRALQHLLPLALPLAPTSCSFIFPSVAKLPKPDLFLPPRDFEHIRFSRWIFVILYSL